MSEDPLIERIERIAAAVAAHLGQGGADLARLLQDANLDSWTRCELCYLRWWRDELRAGHELIPAERRMLESMATNLERQFVTESSHVPQKAPPKTDPHPIQRLLRQLRLVPST